MLWLMNLGFAAGPTDAAPITSADSPGLGAGGTGRILGDSRKGQAYINELLKKFQPVEELELEEAIEFRKDHIADLERREERMKRLLMIAQGTENAIKQADRLQRLQERLTEQRRQLDDEQALLVILLAL